MNLNRKIVALLFVGMTLYTVVGFVFHHYLILPSFADLEEEEARTDMRRCLATLESHISQIASLCNDWSAWDDTYEFVAAPSAAYEASNLYPSWFIENDMSVLYFVRQDGSNAWGQFFDLATGTPAPFPDFEGQAWPPDHPLLNHSGRASVVRGILRTSRGPMLVVSRPILPSEPAEGERVRGTLIMGRLLDDTIINSIRRQSQVALDIIDVDREPIPTEALGLKTDEIRTIPDSTEILLVTTQMHDIQGRDALVLKATVPRRIMARGESAIRLDMLAAAIAGFVFLLMLLTSMKWIVSDPLQQLSAHVKEVGFTRNMDPVPLAGRSDEIGEVAREFNHMLKRLQAEEAELTAAEAALRASQERTRTILDTAPDAILIIDLSGHIESANQAASTLFGHDAGTFRGMRAAHLIAAEYLPAWDDALARAAQPGYTGAVEAEMAGQCSDGVSFPVHLIIATTVLEGKRYFTCAARDISSLKAMQEKVARNQHLARIGEMGATVAHEIRNPLAGIKGALQICSGGTLDTAEQANVLREVDGLIDRISGTVEQLLNYAKPMQAKPEYFALRGLIESVSRFGGIQPPAGTPVTIECESDLMLHADPRLFRQVLENLWANACQAVIPPGGIHLRVHTEEDEVTLRLFNAGRPVRASDLPHVFEPFFTTRVEGSGLGLAVTRRIVEAHDGSVYIENEEGQGVTVVVRLPQGD